MLNVNTSLFKKMPPGLIALKQMKLPYYICKSSGMAKYIGFYCLFVPVRGICH